MLLDANLLLYAVDTRSRQHASAARWLQQALNGNRRVGIPWQTIGTFLRIATHPRITVNPLAAEAAVDLINDWLQAEPVWIPPATERTASVFGELAAKYQITGNLVPDAELAALALEHGIEVMSADTDFARFKEVRWRNPLA